MQLGTVAEDAEITSPHFNRNEGQPNYSNTLNSLLTKLKDTLIRLGHSPC